MGGETITRTSKLGEYKVATVDNALDVIYEESIKAGANGLINVKITPLSVYQSGITFITGYNVSGMAIKK